MIEVPKIPEFHYLGKNFETLNKYSLFIIDEDQYWVESRFVNYQDAEARVSQLIKTGLGYHFKIYNPEGQEIISF